MAAVLPMLALVLSTLVALSDFYARRVPNAWLLVTLAIAVVAALLTWMVGTPHPVWPSIPGLVTGLVTMLPFYAIRWMGAGDVKFFATLGFLLGVRALLPIWAIACLMTGVHTMATLLFRMPRVAYTPGMATARRRVHASPLWRRSMLARQGRAGQPHAAYLGIATFITVLHPELMQWGPP